jgi:hypothetical protein
MAVKRFFIEKDRRDAGPTNQSIPTFFGIHMRDHAGRSNNKLIPIAIPPGRSPYSFAIII